MSPTGESRPFDARRDGFVMGEGAGILVLETAEHAAARGATPLARLTGFGSTCDAHHLTAPREDGVAAAEAIRLALADAGRGPEDVSYVNAHGTSTPLNDAAETRALKAALGEHAATIPVSSTKSVIGHLLGAAGAVEAVATTLALQQHHRWADRRLGAAGGGPGSRLRARCAAPADGRPARRPQQLVRFRWAQRRALPGALLMALAVAPRPDERLTALERLEVLFDHGSVQLLRTDVRSRRLGDRATAGDGVLAAVGEVDGRRVAAYAQDGTFLGGSLGAAHADTVVETLRIAERARIPLVGLVESGGARLQEGLDALDGYARIFAGHVRLSASCRRSASSAALRPVVAPMGRR